MKSEIKLLMPLIAVVFLSCVSFKPVYLDLTAFVLEGQGDGVVSEIKEEGETLLLVDKNNTKEIAIRFTGEISVSVFERLKNASSYEFLTKIRPDGPIEALKLMNDLGLSSYLGDGVRPGNLPGLSLELSTSASDSIRISSPEGRWKVRTGKPETILIDGVEFSAYLLNTQRGDPQFDQPPFKADLILIRK